MSRPSWDDYFLGIAAQVAARSTCDRRHVGAVAARPDGRVIVATGYNGSIRGLQHCDEVGHLMHDGHCIATVHAEANAIAQAARIGAALDGATLYVTDSPCWSCFKLLANAGITRVVFMRRYDADAGLVGTAAKALGIHLVGPQALEKPPGPYSGT